MIRLVKRRKQAMTLTDLDKNKKYLLACSYGPDSMALFYLLLQQGYKFDVSIINYHLREESSNEVKGLEDFCLKHHKFLYVLDINYSIKGNTENECRKIRYSHFKKLVDFLEYDGVLVGHHQDDLIETYLLQKNRQNLPIYYGIKEKTKIFGMDVIRPLLNYSKAELLKICDDNNIPYALDSSNFDSFFSRNRIRHEIVEKMSVSHRAKIIKEIDAKNAELNIIFDKLSKLDLNDIKTLLSLDEITYLYAINEVARKASSSAYISKSQAREILKIMESSRPNVRTKIKGGLFLVKEYDSIYFELDKEEATDYSYDLYTPCELDTPYFYLNFTNGASNRNVTSRDYPLVIRNASLSDKTIISGYKVQVRRLFIDWKMPASLRKRWPVIVNKSGDIIYVPRYRKDFKIKPDSNFFVKTN